MLDQSKQSDTGTQKLVFKLTGLYIGLIYLVGILVNPKNIFEVTFLLGTLLGTITTLIPILEYYFKLPMFTLPVNYIGVDKKVERKIWLVFYSILLAVITVYLVYEYIFPFI